MKFTIACAILGMAATAAADPTIYSAVSGNHTVEATFPNGNVVKRKLSDGSESAAHESFLVPPGVDKLALKVFDDTGKEVWKGSSGPNDVHVLIPDGKDKVKGVFAGHYSGTGDTPRAALFINIADTDVTLDLVGQNGVGAHRGIKPGKAFDPKQLVRLDPKETYFQVEVKAKGGGDAVKTSGKVEAGRYYLVSKHPREGYRLLSLGHIPPPKKK
jgi:hypothetical protein